MRLKLFGLFIIIVILSGCAGTVKYSEPSIADGAAADTATLHVLRPNSVWGSAIRTPVNINNQLIGRLGPGGHLKTKVPVGHVSVSVTTSDVVLDAEKDAEYFVKVTMPAQLWFMTPSFNIKLMEEAEGKVLMEKNDK